MFDTRKREVLESEIQEALREYSKAQTRHKDAMDRAMAIAMKDQPIPRGVKDEFSEAEWDLKYWLSRLEEVKKSYIKLIESISIPPA